MKKAIRCCISCILPCGALDVIRIVHANGRVEHLSGAVKAEDIMKLHPKHVLKKPSSSEQGGPRPKIAVVPPDADLKRGKIYFLMPLPPPPPPKNKPKRKTKLPPSESGNVNDVSEEESLISDRLLGQILSERVSSQRRPRRGRGGAWRPHLDSISETPAEA